jgi:RHS repeat-associated protein
LTDTFTYDAFGLLIGRTGATPNLYLYAGEQFDPDLGLYYNRARYLNVGTGRFWTMDSYEGVSDEPLSLHKYAYAHNDPLNLNDPSGFAPVGLPLWFYAAVGRSVEREIFRDFLTGATGPLGRLTNRAITTILRAKGITPPLGPRLLGLLVRPDLIDLDLNMLWEIKPRTALGLGSAQITGYILLLSRYDPHAGWGTGTALQYDYRARTFTTTVAGLPIIVQVDPTHPTGVITYDWDFPNANLPLPNLQTVAQAALLTTLAVITALIVARPPSPAAI